MERHNIRCKYASDHSASALGRTVGRMHPQAEDHGTLRYCAGISGYSDCSLLYGRALKPLASAVDNLIKFKL